MPEQQPFLNDDGTLRIVRWAADEARSQDLQILSVDLGERAFHMAHSVATGAGTVSNGHLGADVIRLAAGEAFAPHTHPGDHLLIVIGGLGTITYDGKIYPTRAGEVYMVEGAVAHAVGAITNHVILAVGCPHKPVDSPERMKLVEYKEVLAKFGTMHCLICDLRAEYPVTLRSLGCPHDAN